MKWLLAPLSGKIDHRNISTIHTVLMIGGLILMVCGALWLPLLPVGIFCLVAGTYLDYVYWRCPRCFSRLPSRDRSIQVCPHCKKKLYL